VCQTYGTAKQGAKFGYTKVRGYHPLLATLVATGEVLHARMRGGNAGSARGAGTFVRETIRRVRDAGVTGALTIRADSAFYSRAFVSDTAGSWRRGPPAAISASGGAPAHNHRRGSTASAASRT
jgi:hypothetical protein